MAQGAADNSDVFEELDGGLACELSCSDAWALTTGYRTPPLPPESRTALDCCQVVRNVRVAVECDTQ